MPYIEVIDHSRSEDELRRIYDELIRTRGKLAAVHQIQSLNPPTIVSHMALYQDIMFGRSPLKRAQREMIGVIVSGANRCEYCVLHHKKALLHFWKSEARVDALLADPASADLSAIDVALCEYACKLTKNPSSSGNPDIESLRTRGLSDRGILDASLVVAYFNFVNRLVLGLGVIPGPDEVDGYNYD